MDNPGQAAQNSNQQSPGSPGNPDSAGSSSSPSGAADSTSQMGPGTTDVASGSTKSSGPQQLQQDQPGSGGGAGSSPGAAPLGNTPSSLDTRGVRLTIVGKSSGNGTGTTSAGDRSDPLTAAGPSSIDAASGAASVPSNVPINVHQESNSVPLNLKPIVRDYFSDAGS